MTVLKKGTFVKILTKKPSVRFLYGDVGKIKRYDTIMGEYWVTISKEAAKRHNLIFEEGKEYDPNITYHFRENEFEIIDVQLDIL